MPTIAVYRFERYDKATRSWTLTSYRATKEHIDSLDGAAYLGSKLLVDERHVVGGVYRPPKVVAEG